MLPIGGRICGCWGNGAGRGGECGGGYKFWCICCVSIPAHGNEWWGSGRDKLFKIEK